MLNRFEAIHSFLDGNGRVGRLRFFLRGISIQAQDRVFCMTRLQGIRTNYEVPVQTDRNSTRMAAVIDFIFSQPILSIKQLETALDMPYMAAKRYIEKLVDANVLQETTGYVRNRVFQANEIFEALGNSE